MTSIQAGAREQFSDSLGFTAGVAVHHFNNLSGHNLLVTPTAPTGNSTTVTTTSGFAAKSLTANKATTTSTYQYATAFNLINPGVELRTQIKGHPCTMMFDYLVNGLASTENNGYLVGFKLGKPKAAGEMGFNYDYRQLRTDASVAAFTDGDSFGGGTDGNGHRISAIYQVAKNMNTALTGYIGKAGIAAGETSVRRDKVHVDLNFKF